MRVGETEAVDAVTSNDEKTQVETEGNDGNDESEEGSEGPKDTENEVGSEREEESDKSDSGGDRSEDQGEGQVTENGFGGDVLGTRELRDEVTRVTQLGARTGC